MRKILFYLRIYGKLVSQYIKARMQYRVDFLIGFIGMIFWNITGILTIWVLFQSIPHIAGWNFYELVFMYGFMVLALMPYEFFFVRLNYLGWDLVDGSFIIYYFRPLNMMFYYMSGVFELKGFGQLVLGIIIIVYASLNLHIQWTFYTIALLIVMYISSSLVVISLMLLSGCAGFWMLRNFSVIRFVYQLREIARYPLTIFNNLFRFIFTFIIPVGFITYYPLQVVFKSQTIHPAIFASPFVGIGLFTLTYVVWKKGVNSYSGTGS